MDFIEPNDQIKKLQDELESVKKQLQIQQEEYNKLKQINKQYVNVITKNLAVKILEDLFDSGNLAITAKKFGCDPIALYPHIINWDGCSDGLQNLESSSSFIKIIGEPIGYCAAWSMFFTELCLKNPEIPSSTLINYIFNTIYMFFKIYYVYGIYCIRCLFKST